MSYQRWTEGDAYVIGSGDAIDPFFVCVACEHAPRKMVTYEQILKHVVWYHIDSAIAIGRLETEAKAVGIGSSWPTYVEYEQGGRDGFRKPDAGSGSGK